MTPILKWAGGKRQILPHLLRLIDVEAFRNGGGRYYEPFFGGGALCFEMELPRIAINDINTELINVYEVIRESPRELLAALRNHQLFLSKEYYYEIRAMDRRSDFKEIDPVFRAARIIFLNKTCFNGLYRVNSQGYFNVPMGKYKNPDIANEAKILAMSEYLINADVVITNGGFEQAVLPCEANDLIYFDPPYDYTDNGFTSYSEDGFSKEDLLRLRDLANDLINRGCTVILSNNSTEYVNRIFNEFEIIPVSARRSINRNSAGRNNIEEVIIYGHP